MLMNGEAWQMDRKLKHLEFIQGTINRLSTNSFLLKGWSVVLVAGLFAFAAANSELAFVYLAYFPAVVFWGLDGYFLWQERVYRELYNRVRVKEAEEIDFSMDTRDVSNDVSGWVRATFSKTLIPFHGVLIGAIIIVMVILIVRG
jgi:hypothetical protein